MMTRREKMNHHEDTFAPDDQGWCSPSVMQDISDGIDELTKQLQELEDSIPKIPQ